MHKGAWTVWLLVRLRKTAHRQLVCFCLCRTVLHSSSTSWVEQKTTVHSDRRPVVRLFWVLNRLTSLEFYGLLLISFCSSWQQRWAWRSLQLLMARTARRQLWQNVYNRWRMCWMASVSTNSRTLAWMSSVGKCELGSIYSFSHSHVANNTLFPRPRGLRITQRPLLLTWIKLDFNTDK